MLATQGRQVRQGGYHGGGRAPLQRMPVDRIPVWLQAADPISRAGLAATLRPRPDIRLIDAADAGPDSVVVVAVERIDDDARRRLGALRRRGFTRIVLIASSLAGADGTNGAVEGVVGDGVSAVARRSDATPALLVRLVAAAGRCGAPPASVPATVPATKASTNGGASIVVDQPRPRMSEREIAVLRLIAEGFDTREIGERLCYSERTVKTILNDVTNRFHLRNRSHAVAYALREGLIN